MFIDLTSLCRTLTGIEKYAQNVALALLRQAPEDTTFHLMFRKEIHPSFSYLENERFIKVLSPFKAQILTEQIFIPYYLAMNQNDLCVFPSFPPGLLVFKSIVFFCPDATMWRYKDFLSLKNKLYFKPLSTMAMYKAKHICTISDSSKKDISHYFSMVQNKISNIGAALPGKFTKSSEVETKNAKHKFEIKGDYLLTVSSLEPRKNLPLIIKSVAPVLKKRNIQLLLAGRKAWGNEEIEAIIKDYGVQDKITATGYISDFELQCLYSGAKTFIYASKYEGFGFPILEAFACECPVITSNVSSMPEVAGDAALFVDPNSQESIRNAVIRILGSEQLRNDLIHKGTERLKSFSWDETARRFLKAISNAST